jgi:hypothetical protein
MHFLFPCYHDGVPAALSAEISFRFIPDYHPVLQHLFMSLVFSGLWARLTNQPLM